MKKNRRIIKFLVFALAFILCILPFTVKKAEAQKQRHITVDAKTGLAGNYIGNRKMPISVTVTSQEDFSGTCSLVVHADHDTAIEKQINIAAGESKELLYYFTGDASIEYMVYITDENGDVAYKMKFNKEGYYANGTQTAILSDKTITAYPAYVGDGDVFIVKTEEVPEEADALECLDVIVVDNVDLTKLTKLQLNAITGWVDRGGTLALMTGSNYSGPLYAFPADMVSGKVEGVKRIVIDGEELDSSVFSLDSFETDMKYEDQTIFFKKNYGSGVILASPISFILPYSLEDTLGIGIYNYFANSLSEVKKERLTAENTGINSYYLSRMLESEYMNAKPNVALYMIVLLVYVLLIGPVLYLILKKVDKRQYTWAIVPGEALVFTLIIYLLGSTTRSTEPKMTYFTTLDINDSFVKEKTNFCVRAPYNKSYSLVSEGDYNITPTEISGYYGFSQVNYPPQVTISKSSSATKVYFNNPATFEDFRLVAEKNHIGASAYDYVLNTDPSGNVTGTFTNGYSFPLKHLLAYHNNMLFYIADEVAPGETVSFDSSTEHKLYVTSFGYVDFSSFFEEVFGPEYYRHDKYEKVRNAYGYSLQQRCPANTACSLFAAYVEDADFDTFASNCEMKNDGTTIMYMDADPGKDTGISLSVSIDRYMTKAISGKTNITWDRYIETDDSIYEYTFDSNLLKIQYREDLNNEFSYKDYEYFPGDIYFLNYRTGEYDKIFESGVAGELSNLDPYLNDGVMTIDYRVDPQVLKENYYSITMPVLSAIFAN